MTKRIASSLFLFFLCTLSYGQCNADDCLSKGAMAIFVYNQLYDNNNPNEYPSFNYPNPFVDIYNEPSFDDKIRVISYLDYNDGVTVFESQSAGQYFIGSAGVTRYDAIAFLLEAWDIKPDYVGNVSYDDITSSNPYFGYINEAEDLDLLEGVFGGNFNGQFGISTQEFVQILNNILSDNDLHPVSQNKLQDERNYFLPNNYQPETLGFLRGIEQGVFSHYAKNSFVIPDRKMSLDFSHYYSTQLVELPQSYFPIQPLGRGWTHNYNAYIVRESVFDAQTGDGTSYYHVKWADGSINIYDINQDNYITQGVYDDLDDFNGSNRIEIRTKNQIIYFFERLDNDKEIFYLYRIEDRNNNRINISYEESEVDNDFERITTVTAPSGKKLEFSYHSNTDYIKEVSDPINRVIKFRYNEERLKYFNDAKDQETKYYYVSNDEDVSEENQYTRFLLRRIKLPRGNNIYAEYDENNDGKLTKYTFNEEEYLVDVIINYDDNTTPITSTVQAILPSGLMETQSYQYNANGLMVDYRDNSNDVTIEYPSSGNNILLPNNITSNGLDIDYEYDGRGNIVEINKENGQSVEYLGYSSDNELVTYTDANGNITQIEYDNKGNIEYIVDAEGNDITFSHDEFGLRKSSTNQEGITVNYTYQNDGAVSSISAPENLSSSYTYDGINRILSQTVNEQTASYSYDENDNVTSLTNIGNLVTSYDYDKNDNLTKITNANNIDIEFDYDDNDRVTSEKFANLIKEYSYNDDGSLDDYRKTGGDLVKYKYDDDGRLEKTGSITDVDYDNRNRLESITNASTNLDFSYDDLNRVTKVVDSYTVSTIEYEYDDVGNLTQMTYPDGFKVFYAYDKKNRLVKVGAQNASGDIDYDITTYSYLRDDRLLTIVYGNKIEIVHSYDDAGRLISKFALNLQNSEILYEQNLSFDNRGNISSQNIRYRIEEELAEPEPNFDSASYSYNENNHIGGNSNVNNDGNQTTNGTDTYIYDIDDRLTQRQNPNTNTNISYVYNPYGHLISRTENGNEDKYVWDVLSENIIVSDKEGNTQKHIYGLGLEATIDTEGNIYYYHGDHRGNVLMITDDGRNIVKRYSYDDFGKTTALSSSDTESQDSFTFMGKYGILNEDSEQGLYYVRARYYDATTGRFLTQDPVWSANLYPYADNNPISRIDPSGKSDISTGSEAINILLSIPETIGSYYGLDDWFHNNGYGDAANLLSQENVVWDYAISNPKRSGLIIGVGAAGVATATAGGIVTLAHLSTVSSAVTTKYLLVQGGVGFLGVYSGFTLEGKLTGLFVGLDDIEKNGYSVDNRIAIIKNGSLLLIPILSSQYKALKPLRK